MSKRGKRNERRGEENIEITSIGMVMTLLNMSSLCVYVLCRGHEGFEERESEREKERTNNKNKKKR